ncbi:hypothetical protein L3Y34_013726 [Caenorhabditis briggsae]|uniref:Uncharacterized protein n=1 Tax=Caenorhabditis briggsae TaxID=6238 RepID=A0AAE9CY82_CAEBR|nr:hypothetical protein L3Y34_013726 [Caenorhabditis briggsae]
MTWKITASECSTHSLSTFIMCVVGKATIYIPRLRHKLILKVFPLMFRCDGHLPFQKAKSVKRKSINTSTETRTYHKRRWCQRWNCCCCQNFCTYQGWHIWWRFVAAVAASVAAENIAPVLAPMLQPGVSSKAAGATTLPPMMSGVSTQQ